MVERRATGPRQAGSNLELRWASSTVVLDRRQFLRLAAASGIVAASSAAGFRMALAQEAGPASPNAVTTMAAALGHDPERIFRFVQEEIRYEPYEGLLRGPQGTLLARAGNSVDQASLLGALLEASAIGVRYASGTLDETGVVSLMATTVLDAETAHREAAEAIVSDEDIAAGIDWRLPAAATPEELAGLPTLDSFRDALEADEEALGGVAAGHLQRTIEMIASALTSVGVELPMTLTPMPELERTGHTWVRARDGDAWLDLDPSAPRAAPGEMIAPVDAEMDGLPDELRHRVDFHASAEAWLGGVLAEETILEASAFVDQLMNVGVAFLHLPASDIADIDLIGAGLSDGTQYNPLLVMGSDVLVGTQSISFGGGGGSGFIDAFGGGGGEGLVDGETTAEWLTVTVTSPGAEPVSARRAIFDRIGVPMRASGVIDPTGVSAVELIDVGDGVGAHYLPTRGVRAFTVTGAPVNLKAFLEGVVRDGPSFTSIVPGGYGALLEQLSPGLAASTSVRRFTDAPNVAAWTLRVTPGGITEELDLWHRSFGTLGVIGGPPSAPPALVAGVIPHVIERIAMGEITTAGEASDPAAPSVGAILDAAATAGVPIRAYAGGLPEEATYEPAHRAALEEELAAGFLVVAPGAAVDLGAGPRMGWWRIDPVTGAAVDERDDGAGGAAGETTVIISVTSFAAMMGHSALHSARVVANQNPAAVTDRIRLLYAQLQSLVGRL